MPSREPGLSLGARPQNAIFSALTVGMIKKKGRSMTTPIGSAGIFVATASTGVTSAASAPALSARTLPPCRTSAMASGEALGRGKRGSGGPTAKRYSTPANLGIWSVGRCGSISGLAGIRGRVLHRARRRKGVDVMEAHGSRPVGDGTHSFVAIYPASVALAASGNGAEAATARDSARASKPRVSYPRKPAKPGKN